MDIKEYVDEKIKILKELHIVLSRYQLDYVRGLKTESEVDRFAHNLIMRIGEKR